MDADGADVAVGGLEVDATRWFERGRGGPVRVLVDFVICAHTVRE